MAVWAAAVLLASCHRPAAEVAADLGPVVPVAAIGRRDLAQTLTLQAEFRPYQEVELHAKTAGYLRSIAVDFGDEVQAGQLIATLEVPELADDLERALAASQRAAADFDDVQLEATRLAEVMKTNPHLLAQQEIDAAEAKARMAAANLAGAKAEADKYRTLLSYTRITAPFAGVITQRYVDPGTLIQAGTASAQAAPLVRLSQNDRLRLDFPISVSYVDSIVVGDRVEIRLEGSDRVLTACIARLSGRVETATRTMQTEVEVPNADLKLVPGMYATVTLKVHRHLHALAVPVEAVAGSAHPTVDLIGPGGTIVERGVRLGLETPNAFEVLAGLREGDLVLVGGRGEVHAGERVQTKLTVRPDLTP